MSGMDTQQQKDAVTEHVIADILSLAGKAWEDSITRYRATPWWRPIQKFRNWRKYCQFDELFENYVRIYSLYQKRRQERLERS